MIDQIFRIKVEGKIGVQESKQGLCFHDASCDPTALIALHVVLPIFQVAGLRLERSYWSVSESVPHSPSE